MYEHSMIFSGLGVMEKLVSPQEGIYGAHVYFTQEEAYRGRDVGCDLLRVPTQRTQKPS